MHSPAQTETVRSNTPSRATGMPLQGYLLILVRTGWVMVALRTIICFFLSIPVEFVHLQTVCMSGACGEPSLTVDNVRELQAVGLSIGFFTVYFLVLEVVFTLTWLAVGTVIFWRKSNDRMALLTSLWLITFGAEFGFAPQNLGTIHHPFVAVRHARIVQTRGGWIIEALALSGPVTVNHIETRQEVIRNGDMIGLGKGTTFRFLAYTPAPAVQPSSTPVQPTIPRHAVVFGLAGLAGIMELTGQLLIYWLEAVRASEDVSRSYHNISPTRQTAHDHAHRPGA